MKKRSIIAYMILQVFVQVVIKVCIERWICIDLPSLAYHCAPLGGTNVTLVKKYPTSRYNQRQLARHVAAVGGCCQAARWKACCSLGIDYNNNDKLELQHVLKPCRHG